MVYTISLLRCVYLLTAGNSGGYYIQMLNGAEDPSSAQEYYKTRVNDAVSYQL